jgi:type I restriction enzyme, R subunit
MGNSEARTRKEKIDPILTKAGWDMDDLSQVIVEVDTKQSDFVKRDYKTFEETFVNNEEKAYADYLLLDSRGDPLAIIEAKKTSKDPLIGQKQAEGYADDIKKQTGQDVFIFLTNGYEIWFWNREYDGIRPLKGFYSRDDLETTRYQNISKKDFSDIPINNEITNRDYQTEAIKRVCEGVDRGRRKFLLVMATGSGKTRVAMSIVDVMLRTNRVKRVLFLADRKELRDQAYYENFKKFFPNESMTIVYSGSVDQNSRIYASTIQTFENVFRDFSVGFFDLIISDEAHRSIFNKWKDVFTYFDALQVGLTATPSDMIEKDSFRFFDCHDGNPTFLYTYEQAIADGHLCDYTVHQARTQFQLEGLTHHDVPEAEKLRLYEEGVENSDLEFSGSQIEKKVAVLGTNEALVKEFMENCVMDESGTLPAKTIIFPVSIKHAKRIWEVFEKFYPEYKGKLARLITSEDSRAKELIKDFKKASFPRIAISVGMLDTGVDIPEVCNLVFAKPVFSKIRFWQMIGRGTRHDKVCSHREWLPNGVKEDFLIFDFWNNFEYFKMHPKGKESSPTKAVTSRIFLNRLNLYEKFIEAGDEIRAEKIKQDIINYVKLLPKENVTIKEKLRNVELAESEDLWKKISKEPIPFLKKKIAPLMKYIPDVNLNEAMFTLKCEQYVMALLEGNEKEQERVMEMIAEYAESLPMTLNAVKAKKAIIDMVTKEDFWMGVTTDDLFKIRDELTDLMSFKQPDPTPQIVIDMGDMIKQRTLIEFGPDRNEEYVDTYQAKVEKKIKEMAESEPIVQKIRREEALTESDLEQLEKTLNAPDLFITEDNLKKIYSEHRGTMVQFVKNILGLYKFPDPKEKIKEAFSTFVIEKNYLNANQVNFIRTLATVFSSTKHVELETLFNPPFTNIGSPTNLFKKEELEEMVVLCNKLEIEVFEKR